MNKIILLFVFPGFLACNKPETTTSGDKDHSLVTDSYSDPIEWTKNLSIYEVNIRQYTEEGSLEAFSEHLPRLKEMGLGILWLMPVQPIGEVKRKGSLGSYYSIKNYKEINPEFGTMEDLKMVVDKAHDLGMYVILDWVANHSAWDCNLVTEHPEWYSRNEEGQMIPPVADWSDVVDFNYDNRELWDYMQDAMKFWLIEANIDGFRCDVAGEVPLDFWKETLDELQEVKPDIIMLAEDEDPRDHKDAFHMTYGWELHHIMNQIAQGKKSLEDLHEYFEKEDSLYPQNAYRMFFITNHDENSWNGTVKERMGAAGNAFAVLSATAEQSMPLIYSGQEAGLENRLEFFEKDRIIWQDHAVNHLYTKLIKLKLENRSLWNGIYGGDVQFISNDKESSVLSFLREKEDDRTLVVLNLSPDAVKVKLNTDELYKMQEIFSGKSENISEGMELDIPAWGYKVYSSTGSL